MLRAYILQLWYTLADEALEDAIYDSQAMCDFIGTDLAVESVPDATTLLRFRHRLEEPLSCSSRLLVTPPPTSSFGSSLSCVTLAPPRKEILPFLYVERFTRFLYRKPAKNAALDGRAERVKKTTLYGGY